MPQHGGKRAGAGRPAGARNRATAERKASLTELAQSLTDIAIQTLKDVALTGQSESARVAAANAILDRGYGRPFQAVQITGVDEGPVQVIDPTRISTDALRELIGAMSDEATETGEGGSASD